MIDISRFSVNQKIAAHIGMDDFFSLVNSCGIRNVELRNDIPSFDFHFDTNSEVFDKLLETYHINIININALYPFNNNLSDVILRAEHLLKKTASLGIESIVMCPEKHFGTPDDEITSNALIKLAPLFRFYGVKGLVEPLGDERSTLRSFAKAQKMIAGNEDVFSLLIDSFHLYKSPENTHVIKSDLDIENIGLVHLSGISNQNINNVHDDFDRVMLSEDDLIGNDILIATLERMGYKGIYSFEPFSKELTNWNSEKIRFEILNSINLINSKLPSRLSDNF